MDLQLQVTAAKGRKEGRTNEGPSASPHRSLSDALSTASHREHLQSDLFQGTQSTANEPFVRTCTIKSGPRTGRTTDSLALRRAPGERAGSESPRSTSGSGALCRRPAVDPEPKCGIVGRNPPSARERWCLLAAGARRPIGSRRRRKFRLVRSVPWRKRRLTWSDRGRESSRGSGSSCRERGTTTKQRMRSVCERMLEGQSEQRKQSFLIFPSRGLQRFTSCSASCFLSFSCGTPATSSDVLSDVSSDASSVGPGQLPGRRQSECRTGRTRSPPTWQHLRRAL
jgi:hypothetical protein